MGLGLGKRRDESHNPYAYLVLYYQGSAPRAAGGTRYALARATHVQSKLPCAVQYACWRCHVLIGNTGVIFVGGQIWGLQENKLRKSRRTVHNVYYSCFCSMFERKHSATRHDTAAQGTAQHRTTPHSAALRRWAIYIYSWNDLTWACTVIQPRKHIFREFDNRFRD